MVKQLLVLLIFPVALLGQSGEDLQALREAELDLYDHAMIIALSTSDSITLKANYTFIPKLVEALKIPGSFNYPFDSLRNISINYPKDRSFRILTWQMKLTSGRYRYFGAIQYPGNQLKLTPLIDYKDSIPSPTDTILGTGNWYGAFYYNMLEYKHKGKMYYTLIGYNGNDLWSHKKVIEVLTFEDGMPVFGAPIFEVDPEYLSARGKPIMRLILEYKADATMGLNYDEKEEMIVYDHLIPSQNVADDLKFTHVPDGAYDGYEWVKGKWVHRPNIYNMSVDRENPGGPRNDK